MKKSAIFFTTFLALPLSFVGIPIYLNIADFYAQKFGLSLVLIGVLLACVRFIDAVQDPFVGYYSDFLCSKKITRKKIINIFSLLLSLGFFLVFNPLPNLENVGASIWFFATLSLTYLCFNFVIINFESLIAVIAQNDKERIALNSAKEFLGLIGMIFAFTIPVIFNQVLQGTKQQNYFYLSLVFAALILLNVTAFLPKVETLNQLKKPSHKINFKIIFADKKFLNFALIFFLNSIAVSLPAANMNFYIREVLLLEQNLPYFLATYFIAACLFIPLWRYLFSKFGIIKSWIISIAGAISTFAFAYFLNEQNAMYFYLVCLLSGAFLGADLIAVPTILAQITKEKSEMVSSYFALWNFLTKIALMIAASGSLIILGFFGYQPQNSALQNLNSISFFYAALPCLIKAVVIILLLKFQKYENQTTRNSYVS